MQSNGNNNTVAIYLFPQCCERLYQEQGHLCFDGKGLNKLKQAVAMRQFWRMNAIQLDRLLEPTLALVKDLMDEVPEGSKKNRLMAKWATIQGDYIKAKGTINKNTGFEGMVRIKTDFERVCWKALYKMSSVTN